MASVVLTTTAARHFRKILQDTKRKHGVEQMKHYSALLKKGFAEIPERHRRSLTKREEMTSGTGFEIQHIQHYYAVYKDLGEGKFAVAALLWEGRDIPARLRELQAISAAETAVIKKALGITDQKI